MSEVKVYQAEPMGPAQMYRHSGRVPAGAMGMGLLAAVGLGSVYGVVFGFLELYAHLIPIGKLMFLAVFMGALGLGAALGTTVGRVLRKFKARSGLAAVGMTLLAGAAAMYWAWVFFLFAYFLYIKNDVPLSVIARPDNLWDILKVVNENGIWSMGTNDTPTGWFLGLIWVAEACMIVGMAVKVATKEMSKQVFCEKCERWGESRHLMQVQDEGHASIAKELAEGRVESLCAAKAKRALQSTWCDVTLEGCPDCDNLQTLTVERSVLTVDKKGTASTKSTALVRRLILGPEQVLAVITAAAATRAPVEVAKKEEPAGEVTKVEAPEAEPPGGV